ncbi:hypothetical protein BD779DRAFT_1668355 [Infundibulicybe gibba]|nr:hypothetical protein BD779DRAFT_1668355 [Infundibulicybe gibba]
MAITIEESKLLAIFIQTLLYGAYVVLFVMTCWVLISRRPREQPIHKTMLVIAIAMFVLATMQLITNYIRIIRAFTQWPGGPKAYFGRFSEFTQLFGSTLYIAQTLVGDGILLYRCYIVWNSRFRIIAFPTLLLAGSTATGVGILYSFSQLTPETKIFVPQLKKWIISFFSLTLVTNIICTSLIAFRIWYVNHQCTAFSSRSLRPVLRLVIESGAIYSITLLVLLILYKTHSWFQYVVVDAVSPIIGLVFTMIIVRIGLGLTSPTGQTSSTWANTHPRYYHRGRPPCGASDSENSFPARGYALHFQNVDQQGHPVQLEPLKTALNDMSAVSIMMETKTMHRIGTEEDLRAGSGTRVDGIPWMNR